MNTKRVLLCAFLVVSLLLSGCAPGASLTSTSGAPDASITSTSTPTGTGSSFATALPAPSSTAYPGPVPGSTDSAETAYPGPAQPAVGDTAYPGPGDSQPTQPIDTSQPYPGAQTTILPAPTERVTGSVTPGGSPVPSTPGTGTPLVTPTEYIPTTAEPPPQPAVQTVSIWHSWDEGEQQVLDYSLRSFQSVYPNTRFMVTYYPKEQLQARYAAASYMGEGPSLVLAPAEWGPSFYDQDLVVDVSSIAEADFLAAINPAALEQARYQGALIGLPHTIREGVVLYRNKQIISEPAATFDELIQLSKAATGSGRVGAYLDTSFYFSGGNLLGIGGQFMDEDGKPAFNDQAGQEWMTLLDSYELAGVSRFNTDRDVILFEAGQVGLIIDSTLREAELASAIGEENLVIDPWPSYQSGSLSGFIQTDMIYLNSRTAGDERYSALLVMGFFLAKEVQAILTAAGHIPSVMDISVEDAWMGQAMEAFKRASPYPIRPEFQVYPQPLNDALQTVFEENTSPAVALNQAEEKILRELGE